MTPTTQITNRIIYEHPLNERMRIFFRLEQLFDHISQFWQDESTLACRMIIEKLQAVLDTLGRFDVKGESLKELERFSESLMQWRQIDGIDTHLIDDLTTESESLISSLHDKRGSLGEHILKHEIFNGVLKRSAIAGGPCHFDFPAYHFWLKKPVVHRRAVLLEWLNDLEPIAASIRLILRLIRESSVPQMVVVTDGHFEQSLNPKQPLQCIRVFLEADSPFFPEISASKHQIHMRFFNLSPADRLVLQNERIEFELALCQI